VKEENKNAKTISVVVPFFNEEAVIETFYGELCKTIAALPYNFEFLFVDDGSTDATPLILDRLSREDQRVRALILARNFGFQIALSCGLDHAQGDAVITMDGDMQHPPSLLPELIARWEDGFDVVQTIRVTTEGVSLFKRWTSRMFYKVMNFLSKVHVDEGGSDFRLLDKKVVASFRLFRERARFIRGMISAIGYRQVKVEFVAPKRAAGKSKFSLRKMIRFALDGITAYSNLPLRFAFALGLIFGAISFVVSLHVLYIKLFTNEAVPGWATTSLSVLLLSGIQLVSLGIIGEYVGRIFEEVKQRPLYWLRADLQGGRRGTGADEPGKK